jgi:hypothetical protein
MSEPIDEYVEIPIVLRLKKNIAELLRILSICYSEYPTLTGEIKNKFVSREISKIVIALVEAPPFPEELPENFKQMLRNILNESATNTDKLPAIDDNSNFDDLK